MFSSFLKTVSLIGFAISQGAIANESCTQWEIKSSQFHVKEVLNTSRNFSEKESHQRYDQTGVLELPVTTKILNGELVVEKSCLQSAPGKKVEYQQQTITIPLTAVMRMKGLNLRAGMFNFDLNSVMTISNLEGKTVHDLVDHWYGGAKCGVTVGFVAVCNPNGSFLFNAENGIIIRDVEKLIYGDGYALGVNLSWVSIEFSLRDDYYHTITTSSALSRDNSTHHDEKIESNELLNVKF